MRPQDDQSYSSPNVSPGQPPEPVPPSPSQQIPQPQPHWQPSSPVPKQRNGLAIAALVIAVLALLMGLGFLVTQVFLGAVIGGLMSSDLGFPPSSGLEGTAPQVVAGQPYPGRLLQDEVSRVIGADGSEVTSTSCPATPAVVSGAVTECGAVVDGSQWTFRVTFQDGLGHFTLDQKLS